MCIQFQNTLGECFSIVGEQSGKLKVRMHKLDIYTDKEIFQLYDNYLIKCVYTHDLIESMWLSFTLYGVQGLNEAIIHVHTTPNVGKMVFTTH